MNKWSWPKFAKKVRVKQDPLLARLDRFSDPVLVSGCQRSGGTMLASVLSKHEEIINPFWSPDTELDAALILSGTENGTAPATSQGRHCFQTTYLNERYVEYLEHIGRFRLIWLIRNPHSVVYSMVHNWSRFALNEVFIACGLEVAPSHVKNRFNRFGILAVRPVERACWSYLSKMEQCRVLLDKIPADRITTLDYDELVSAPQVMLPKLLDFSQLSANQDIGEEISTRSISKANRLSTREQECVDRLCLSSYSTARNDWIKLRAE